MSAAAAYFIDETKIDVCAPLANTGITIKRALDLISANCAEFRQAGAKRKIVDVSGGHICLFDCPRGYLLCRFRPATSRKTKAMRRAYSKRSFDLRRRTKMQKIIA